MQFLCLLAAGLTPGIATAASDAAGTAETRELAAGLRQATAQYHNIDAAFADGYVQVTPCIPGMGIHLAQEERIDAVTDPLALLVYLANSQGRYRLVAMEYLSVATTAPSVGGVEFHAGPFPGSWALHKGYGCITRTECLLPRTRTLSAPPHNLTGPALTQLSSSR